MEPSRDKLVVTHLPYARKLALQAFNRRDTGMDVDDLVAAARVGLVRAAGTFDPERRVTFRSYAHLKINAAIAEAVREWDPIGRLTRVRVAKINAARVHLADELDREPTDREIAATVGLTDKQVRLALLARNRTQHSVSLDEQTSAQDEAPQTLGELISDPRWEHPLDQLVRDVEHSALRHALGKLPDRQQAILGWLYVSELTLREIGGLLDLTESRVSQIKHAALKRLRTLVEAAA